MGVSPPASLTCIASDDNNKEATPIPPQEYLNCFTTKLDKNGKDEIYLLNNLEI